MTNIEVVILIIEVARTTVATLIMLKWNNKIDKHYQYFYWINHFSRCRQSHLYGYNSGVFFLSF